MDSSVWGGQGAGDTTPGAPTLVIRDDDMETTGHWPQPPDPGPAAEQFPSPGPLSPAVVASGGTVTRPALGMRNQKVRIVGFHLARCRLSPSSSHLSSVSGVGEQLGGARQLPAHPVSALCAVSRV